MLTEPELDRIEAEFERVFGEKPKAVYLIGSQADGTATTDSEIDIYLETNLPLGPLTKFTPEGFEFFLAINPGQVPNDVTRIGPGPTEALIGGRIPKPGLIDPFFGPAPVTPSRKVR